MKKFLLFLFVQFFTLIAFSQNGFIDGYIINLKGDTVRGKIKDRKEIKDKIGWQKVIFIDEKGEENKFTPDDINGYGKSNEKTFRTLTLGIEARKRFVEILESGNVFLYAYSLGLSPKATPDYFLLKKNDANSLMEWRGKDYKVTAGYFFNADKNLMKLIASDSLKHADIQTIVKRYNEGRGK